MMEECMEVKRINGVSLLKFVGGQALKALRTFELKVLMSKSGYIKTCFISPKIQKFIKDVRESFFGFKPFQRRGPSPSVSHSLLMLPKNDK